MSLTKLRHWWHGCAKFNRLMPHWMKSSGQYPECSVCGLPGYWIWGYKHFPPDPVAQKIQDKGPTLGDRYYRNVDGWYKSD